MSLLPRAASHHALCQCLTVLPKYTFLVAGTRPWGNTAEGWTSLESGWAAPPDRTGVQGARCRYHTHTPLVPGPGYTGMLTKTSQLTHPDAVPNGHLQSSVLSTSAACHQHFNSVLLPLVVLIMVTHPCAQRPLQLQGHYIYFSEAITVSYT